MKVFDSIQEFNNMWEIFIKREKREKWRVPYCSYDGQKGLLI